jgi:hypothetical protein
MATSINNDIILSNSSQRYPPQDTLISFPIGTIKETLGQLPNDILYVPFLEFIIKGEASDINFDIISWRGTLIEDGKTTDIIIHAQTTEIPQTSPIQYKTTVSVSDQNTVIETTKDTIQIIKGEGEEIETKEVNVAKLYWKTRAKTFSVIVNDTYPSAYNNYRGKVTAFIPIDPYASLRPDSAGHTFEDTHVIAPEDISEEWTTYGDIELNLRKYKTFIIHAVNPPTDFDIPFKASVPIITAQPELINEVTLGANEVDLNIAIEATAYEYVQGFSELEFNWYQTSSPTVYDQKNTPYQANSSTLSKSKFETLGSIYFYCEITNKIKESAKKNIKNLGPYTTNNKEGNTWSNSVLSPIYTFNVRRIGEAPFPIIVENPQHAYYGYKEDIKPLFVKAIYPELPGVEQKLTYEWYYSTTLYQTPTVAQNGLIQLNEFTNLFRFSTSSTFLYFYYCKVTNTASHGGVVFPPKSIFTKAVQGQVLNTTSSMPIVDIDYYLANDGLTYDHIDYMGNGIIGDNIEYYRDGEAKQKVELRVTVSSIPSLNYPTDIFNNLNSNYQWYVTKSPEFANNPDKETECIIVGETNSTFKPRLTLSGEEKEEARANGGYLLFYYYCKVTPKVKPDNNWPEVEDLAIKSKVVMIRIKSAKENKDPIISPESALAPNEAGFLGLADPLNTSVSTTGGGYLYYKWYQIDNWPESWSNSEIISDNNTNTADLYNRIKKFFKQQKINQGVEINDLWTPQWPKKTETDSSLSLNIASPVIAYNESIPFYPKLDATKGYFCIIVHIMDEFDDKAKHILSWNVTNAVKISITNYFHIRLTNVNAGVDYKFNILQEQNKKTISNVQNYDTDDIKTVPLQIQIKNVKGGIITPTGRFTNFELIEQIKNRSTFLDLMSFENNKLLLTQYITNIVYMDEQIDRKVEDPDMEKEYNSPLSFKDPYYQVDPEPKEHPKWRKGSLGPSGDPTITEIWE